MNRTYCEVSPRRSGKTTRLLEAARLADNAVVVVWSNAMVLGLKNKICRSDRIVIVSSDVFKYKTSQQIQFFKEKYGLDYFNISWFFDEFDFYDAPRFTGAYYATTPKYIRKIHPEDLSSDVDLITADTLSQLYLRWNWAWDCVFCTYPIIGASFAGEENKKNIKRFMSRSSILTEYYGQFADANTYL